VANVFGFLTHEWKDAPAKCIRTLFSGLAVPIAVIVLLAVGSAMIGS